MELPLQASQDISISTVIDDPPWSSASTVASDFTLHQIAPYIGRMKTSMARSLIYSWTQPGDLIVDPFCGSGVVALEAAASGRKIVAGDWNPYAVLLSRAKIFPPNTLRLAERRLERTWKLAQKNLEKQDLSKLPPWVIKFFHPNTLRSALSFRDACIALNDEFLLACFLGILHHQRPGFLSYPSSHLVPYLRDRKFPRAIYPEMYEERDVLTRMIAKIRRTLRRVPGKYTEFHRIIQSDARDFPRFRNVKAVITSPPYMNELDYIRDNRLRLWFISRSIPKGLELVGSNRDKAFSELLGAMCSRLAPGIVSGGYFIFVIGDATRGGKIGYSTSLAHNLFITNKALSKFHLHSVFSDTIPDIRRSRRECRGTKAETVLVFKKE